MLVARLFIGILLIAALLGVLVADAWLAPWYPLFALGIATIVAVAARELGLMLRRLPMTVDLWLCQAGSVAIILANWWPHVWTPHQPTPPTMTASLCVFVALGMLAFLWAAWHYQSPGAATAALAGHLLVFFYVGLLGSFVVQTRWLGNSSALGATAFFLGVFAAKFNDMGAYFFGRWLGRTKMAPVLSPAKTWEGTLGGLVSAVALAILVVLVGECLTGTKLLSLPIAAVFGFVVGLAAWLGDLMESLIKRDCQQKDASASLPGFGGLLDIIDSILFAGPIVYLLLLCFAGS